MKTIAQISTPLGSGGIAIIRMSGDNAKKIAFKLFHAKNLTSQNIEPRKLYLGKFSLDNATERCMMVYFKAPFSFTGEDVVEFQIHGGEYLATKILEVLLNNGCVLAENGEFSKRAFMNGKMTLDEAEATIDMINATSDAEIKASSMLANGKLNNIIVSIQNKIKDCLVDLEVSIDYPEHNDEVTSIEKVKEVLKNSKEELQKLVNSCATGEKIKFGINVAIIGKPNVGKSSLLNCLIGEERAIVTDVKGTTRDILKETINYKGFKINFIDTAGIRDSQDIVEKIGVEKSKQCIEQSDIVLFVLDASEEIDELDKQLMNLTKNKNVILVLNKIDKQTKTKIDNAIYVSANNNINIEKIKDKIIEMAKVNKVDFSQLFITNARHKEVLKQAIIDIDNAIKSTELNTADIVDMETKRVWKTLGKITGESETESIIDNIFSKFCLGK